MGEISTILVQIFIANFFFLELVIDNLVSFRLNEERISVSIYNA